MANGLLQFLADPNERAGIRQGFMDAVNRGAIGATLGAPVDMANSLLNLVKAGGGYIGHKTGLLSADEMPQLIDNPVGGSEWFGKQMQNTGMVSDKRNQLAEALAGFLPMSPTTSAKAVAAVGMGGMVPGMDAAMFIGPKAKTWDAAAAARALEMEQAQAAPRAIWSETGTYRAPDGLLRQEVSDHAAKVRGYNYTPQQAFKSAQWEAMITGKDAGTTSAMLPYANKTKAQLLAEYKRTGGEIVDAAMSGDKDRAMQLSADRAGLGDLFGAMRNRPYGPMSAYLSHGDLGAAYPDAYRLHTRITNDISPSLGEYVRGTEHTGEQIRLANKPQWSGDKTIPLHELQHAIQAREGFARGGSPEGLAQEYGQARSRLHFLEQEPEFQAANQELNGIWDSVFTKGTMSEAEAVAKEAELLKKYPTLGEQQSLMNVMRNSSEDGYSAYKRLAGEAEARATQARMNMTPAERRATFPLDSYDVPINQLIVR